MKKYIKLLPSLIVLGFLILFFLPSVKGFDDIEFTFEKNTLYNNSEVNNEFFSNFNLRNNSEYTEYYQATYSFNDELEGTNESNIQFVDSVSGTGSVIITNNKIEHKKILALRNIGGGNSKYIYNNFFAQSGTFTIEYWFLFDSSLVNDAFTILFYSDGNKKVQIYTTGNTLYYKDLGNNEQTIMTGLVADKWYLCSLELNTDSDTFNLYINGILKQNDGQFRNIASSINQLRFTMYHPSVSRTVMLDAIGYSFGKPSEINDFTDDIVGQEPIGWTSDNSVGCSTTIKDTLDGETNVLDLLDWAIDTNTANISRIFNQSIYQISFDVATSSLTRRSNIFFLRNNTKVIHLRFLGDEIGYIDGSGYHLIKSTIFGSSNNFIPIKIIFNNTLDTFDIYISNVLEGNDISYWHNTDIIESFMLSTSTIGDGEYHIYYDNFFLNNIPYIIGSNIIPLLLISSNYLEVDKYEFGLENANSLYSLGHHDTVSSWNSIETDDGTSEIIANPLNENDRMLEFEVADSNDIGGISIINLNKNGLFLNVSFRIKLIAGLAHDAYTLFNILSTPSENIVFQLKIDFSDMTLSYNNGSGYTELDDIELNQYYHFYLFINYEIDICTLDYYREGILMEIFNSLPLLILSQSGVYSVAVKCISEGDSALMRLDNVGIYIDSRSLNNNEYAWCTLYLGDSWFSEVYNIFKYKSNGSYHLSIVEGFSYSVGSSMDTLKGFSIYNDTEIILNTFVMDEYVVIPLVLFNIKGGFFNVSTLSAEGVILTQDTHIYYLDFEFGGVNPNVSYFYVDSNNRLQFTYEASKNGVLEFIQASFNINDRDSNNTVIQFTSKKTLGAFGFFRIAFQDTSQLIQIETGTRTKRITVSKLRTIKEFVILISDTNKDDITGFTTGYITNIKLLDVEQAFASVISLNLIGIIIPLIIIILPTMLISKLYGDFLVIPLFVMFSIILTISNMIPIWLFFVILFSSSLFIFFEKDKKEIF